MSDRMKGRVAGLCYLGVVVFGIFALAYAPSRLIVKGDDAATAASIASQIGLFNASICAGLAMSAFFLALPFALASFLSAYGRGAAGIMILFVAASIPFTLLALREGSGINGLMAAGAATPAAVAEQLAGYRSHMDTASLFWGLWLAPLGWLILKSGAVPRILGVLVLFGFAGYVGDYFGSRYFAGYDEISVMDHVSTLGSIGEIGTCLWLLAMGARARPAD